MLAACLMLAMLLTLLSTPALADVTFVDPSNAAVNPYLNTVTIYKWTRHQNSSTLPRDNKEHPVLLVWPNGNTYRWWVDGSSAGKHKVNDKDHECFVSGNFPTDAEYPNPGSMTAEADSFYTLGNVSNVFIEYAGTDSSNGNQPKYKIGTTAFGTRKYLDGWDRDSGDEIIWQYDKNRTSNNSNQMNWTFVGSGGNRGYSKNVKDRYFKVICNTSGADVCFCFDDSGNWLTTLEFGSDWDTMGQMQVYTGEKLTFSAITSDYTVTEANGVFNVDGGVILWEGVTLTVMPGAVLSIDGTFYNNGTIHNYGTILVQDGSRVTRYMPKDKLTAGQIICDGNKVDVQESLNAEHKKKTTDLANLKADLETKTNAYLAAERSLTTARNELNAILNNGIHKAELEKRESALKDAHSASQDQQETVRLIEEDLKAARDAGNSREIVRLEAKLKAANNELLVRENAVAEAQVHYDTYYEACGAKAKEEVCLGLESSMALQELELAEIQEAIESTEKRLAQLEAGGAGNTASSVVEGEGVLILTTGARMETGMGHHSLQIKDGGSLVCGGTLLCPGGLYVENSKVHVMNSGNLFLEYHMKQNILNLEKLELRNPHTLEAGFIGMGVNSDSTSSMELVGNCVVRVDGVLRYATHPIKSRSSASASASVTGIYEGEGIWSTQSGPTMAQDVDGTIIEYWSSTEYRKIYTDGTVEHRNGNASTITSTDQDGFTKTITKAFNGSAMSGITETVTKDGIKYGEITKDGSGLITGGWAKLKAMANGALTFASDGDKWIYVSAANAFLEGENPTASLGDYTAYYWDERATKTFELKNNQTEASGTYKTADGAGSFAYALKGGAGSTYGDWAWSEETRTYSDHTEALGRGIGIYSAGLSKKIESANYTGGAFAGASYRCESAYYQNSGSWEKGELLWTVTAKSGIDQVYTCRALEQGTGELVVYRGTAETPYQTAITFNAASKNLPYPAKYVGGAAEFSKAASDYPLPMREKIESGDNYGWNTEWMTYKVPMTTGDPVEFTDESCLYKAVTEYPNNAKTIITRYYIEDVNWKNHETHENWADSDVVLIWTAISANGEVTKCYAKPEKTEEADKYTNVGNEYQSMRWVLKLAEREAGTERTFTNWTALNYSSRPDPTDFLVSSDLPDTERYTTGSITKSWTEAP